jgi:hypothetical protein
VISMSWNFVTCSFFFWHDILVWHSQDWYLISDSEAKIQDLPPVVIFDKRSASCVDHSKSSLSPSSPPPELLAQISHASAALTYVLLECSDSLCRRCQVHLLSGQLSWFCELLPHFLNSLMLLAPPAVHIVFTEILDHYYIGRACCTQQIC